MKRGVSIERVSFGMVIGSALVFFIFMVWLLRNTNQSFLASMSFVSMVSLFLPRFFYATTAWSTYLSKQQTAIIEIILVLLLSLNGIGALGFYLTTMYFDLTLHVIGPIGTGVIVSLFIGGLLKAKKIFSIWRVQVISSLFAAFLIFFWEFWEFYGDQLLGTSMFGQPGELNDTVYDVIAGLLSLYVVLFINYFIFSSPVSVVKKIHVVSKSKKSF